MHGNGKSTDVNRNSVKGRLGLSGGVAQMRGRAKVSWAGLFMCVEVPGILDEVNQLPNQPQKGVSTANTVWDLCNFHERVYLLQGSHTAPAPYTKSIQRSSGAAQTVNDTPLYPVPATLHPTPAGPRSCGAAQTLNHIPLYAVPEAICSLWATGAENLEDKGEKGPHSCGAVHPRPAGPCN